MIKLLSILLLLTGCTQGECAAPLVLVTNDVAYTNRTLQINPTPTGWALGGTVITQRSDGNTNQIVLGNFSWPQILTPWVQLQSFPALPVTFEASKDLANWQSVGSSTNGQASALANQTNVFYRANAAQKTTLKINSSPAP